MPGRRVAIVTGAGGGLGRAMAAGLARAGLDVVAVHHRGPAPVVGDVTSAADCERIAALAVGTYGRVDVLVNNAGLSHQRFPRRHETELGDVAEADWRAVFDVNVTGAFLMTRAVLPAMLERGHGRVVNVGTSKATMLRASFLPYGASKAALEAMTAGWAARLAGTGVTVNELLPGGPCDTPAQGDRDRRGMWPADVMVPPVVWLARSAPDSVTGRRFVARLWDATLPAAAGFAAGWPLEPHDHPLPMGAV